MIHKVEGGFVISSHRVWLPGCYADEGAARFAFRCKDETLQRLQNNANARGDGVITWGDIAKARAEEK